MWSQGSIDCPLACLVLAHLQAETTLGTKHTEISGKDSRCFSLHGSMNQIFGLLFHSPEACQLFLMQNGNNLLF